MSNIIPYLSRNPKNGDHGYNPETDERYFYDGKKWINVSKIVSWWRDLFKLVMREHIKK